MANSLLHAIRDFRPDLTRLSLWFLALPYAIFLLGWLRWYWAAPLVALLVAALLSTPAGNPRIREAITRQGVALAMLAALATLVQSGVGGFGPQDADWHKHNAILLDLINHPWPVFYQMGAERIGLIYYVAYYLPAALVGKLAGWQAANMALFLWSWFGLSLVLVWFQALVGRGAFWPIVLFIVFSGLDAVGMALLGTWPGWWHLEYWAGQWEYPSMVTQIWWVPQMALGGWIATALMLSAMERERGDRDGPLVLSLTPLYSPFITLGLLPLMAADWLRRPRRYPLTVSMGAAVGLLALAGIYFTSKFTEGAGVAGLIFNVPMGGGPQTALGISLYMVAFWILEFGVYIAVLYWCRRWNWMLTAATVTLITITFFRYGYYNDLSMRGSLAPIFVLAVFVARMLLDPETPRRARRVLVVLVVIGALSPAVEGARHAGRVWRDGTFNYLVPRAEVRNLVQVHRDFYEPKGIPFLRQYTGPPDAPFFTWLGR